MSALPVFKTAVISGFVRLSWKNPDSFMTFYGSDQSTVAHHSNLIVFKMKSAAHLWALPVSKTDVMSGSVTLIVVWNTVCLSISTQYTTS